MDRRMGLQPQPAARSDGSAPSATAEPLRGRGSRYIAESAIGGCSPARSVGGAAAGVSWSQGLIDARCVASRARAYVITEEDRGYETPCHIWQGPRDPAGYGRRNRDGVWTPLHRIVYEEAHGRQPRGIDIDHLCRQPPCIRLDHLEAVTHAENNRRGKGTRLTWDDVHAIRASSATDVELALRFGVNKSHIWRIRANRKWKEAV